MSGKIDKYFDTQDSKYIAQMKIILNSTEMSSFSIQSFKVIRHYAVLVLLQIRFLGKSKGVLLYEYIFLKNVVYKLVSRKNLTINNE